ncbi:adenylosuccinate synthetase [Candidatus Woesearchaeota archaeon]|nr:adenylosuccinate synthetase [Candidatus Woesearchaeota archaeon]
MVFVKAIIGLQYGDEGKGKQVDVDAALADAVVRYGGATNAGHTLEKDGLKFIAHNLPSGVLYDRKHPNAYGMPVMNIMGIGELVDPEITLTELREVRALGFEPDLSIDAKCPVITQWQKVFDCGIEAALGERKIGTTGRGVGPTVMAWANRATSLRMEDLLDPYLEGRVVDIVRQLSREIIAFHPDFKGFHSSTVRTAIAPPEGHPIRGKLEGLARFYAKELASWGKELAGYITADTFRIVRDPSLQRMVLCEGAQGHFLDPDFGYRPDTTSTHPVAQQAMVGGGVDHIDHVTGVLKMYLTRVGSGPLFTETEGKDGEYLREQGGEYGATTGRPRRCGWLNIPEAKEAVLYNMARGIAATKLDVLTGLKEIPIATAVSWKKAEEGYILEDVSYTRLPGWEDDLSGIRGWEYLPRNARKYVEFIEQSTGIPTETIGVGPGQRQVIYRQSYIDLMEGRSLPIRMVLKERGFL